MASAYAFLVQQINAKNRTLSSEQHYFRSEQKRLLLVLCLFGLSYLFRFLWDDILYSRLCLGYDQAHKRQMSQRQNFQCLLVSDSLYVLEGSCFLLLFFLHR